MSDESTPLIFKAPIADDDPRGPRLAASVPPPPPTSPPPPPPPPQDDNTTDTIPTSNIIYSFPSSIADDNDVLQSNITGKMRKKKMKLQDTSLAESGGMDRKKRKNGPHKSICHLIFDVVRYSAIISCFMMFLTQAIPLILVVDESTWLQLAVRFYLAIFCLFFMLVESRIPLLSGIIQNWMLRGFLYSFIGLIGMEQDLAIRVEEISAGSASVLGPDFLTLFAMLFINITAWTMITVGIIYTLLGLFCLQGLYERLEKDHREKILEWKRKKDVEENFRKQKENQRQYEQDRWEGRGEWYDDLE